MRAYSEKEAFTPFLRKIDEGPLTKGTRVLIFDGLEWMEIRPGLPRCEEPQPFIFSR